MTNSMTNYQTTFEATQNLPMVIALGHGENADLVANFTDNGIPVSLSGYTARALFQPKSEWGTNNWYECPCEISEDAAIAHWSNDSDNGDNAVKLFMYLLKDGKVAYPAIYRIGLFETPGHTPGSIVPIQKTLDFSEYNLVNAPWTLPDDLSAYATADSLSAYATNDSLSAYATTEALEEVESKNNYLSIAGGFESSITLSAGTKVYRGELQAIGSVCTIPTPITTNLETGLRYFDYELELYVPSVATTLNGPFSWTWMEGGELPTDSSEFAGKTIYIACRYDCNFETTLANVWRIA